MGKSNKAKLFLTSTALVSSLMVSVNAEASDQFNRDFGNVNITTNGNNTNFDQTTLNAGLSTDNYSVNAGETHRFRYVDAQNALQDVNGNLIMRSTGMSQSVYNGAIVSENVNLTFINGNGHLVSSTGTIDAPSLTMTSSGISNEDFIEGTRTGIYKFNQAGSPDATITNEGTITIHGTGLAALVAPGVENHGAIIAEEGKVALAAGEEFTLDLYGDKLINFAVDASDGAHRRVHNTGRIKGKYVVLTAQQVEGVVKNSVNNDGIIEAETVYMDGDDIVLGAESVITAKKSNGDGGRAVIRARNSLKADGIIDAAAVAKDGKGGFVETSAPDFFWGENLFVTTASEEGEYGHWLIDPANFTVGTGFDPFNPNFINHVFLSLALGNNNITLQTSVDPINPPSVNAQAGDINVLADVVKFFGGDTTLTLAAHRDVNVASGVDIASTSNELGVRIGAGRDVNIDGNIDTNGGDFSATGVSIDNTLRFFPFFRVVEVANVDETARLRNFTNNGTITTGGGDVDINARRARIRNEINAGAGDVTIYGRNLIQIRDSITANRIDLSTRHNGRITLDDRLFANTLVGDTNRVDIVSNNALIQQGIDLVNEDGDVNVGAGTYDENLVIRKSLNLNGDGKDSTIIAPTTNPTEEFVKGNSGSLNTRSIILAQDADDINISDLTVNGENTGNGLPSGRRMSGISYDNASGEVDTVRVHNISDDSLGWGLGINVDSVAGDTFGDVTIKDSMISDFQHIGVLANGSNANVTIENSMISDPASVASSASSGVYIQGGADATLTNNTLDGNQYGVSAVGAGDVSITGGSITNSTEAGVRVTNTDGVEVNHVTISDNKDGIVGNNADNLKVTDSFLHDNTGDGVRLTNGSDNAEILRTDFRGNNNGLVLKDSHDAEVTLSQFRENTNDGIHGENSQRLVVDTTQFYKNDEGIYLDADSSDAKVKASHFGENGNGIRLDGADGAEISDLSTFIQNDRGIVLENNADRTIIKDSFFVNNRIGVDAAAADGTEIRNTLASGNDIGVNLNGSTNTLIKDSNLDGNKYGSSANDYGLRAENVNGLRVEGGSINENREGAHIENSSNVTFDDVDVLRNMDDGIHLANVTGRIDILRSNISDNMNRGIFIQNSDDVLISRTRVAGNTSHGIDIDDSDGLGVIFSNISGNGGDGISGNNSHDAFVSISNVSGNGSDGIELTNSNGATVLLSNVSGNDSDGVDLNNSDDATIALSRVNGNGDNGIEVSDSETTRILASTVSGNGNDGVHANNVNDLGIAFSNISGNLRGDGVDIHNSEGIRIFRTNMNSNGNGSGDNGLELFNTRNVNVERSNINSNRDNGVEITGDSRRITFDNTSISGNRDDGIDADQGGTRNLRIINGSRINGNGDDGIDGRGIRNIRIIDSEVSGNRDNGVQLEDTNRIRVRRSTLANNGGSGALIDDSTNVRFRNVDAFGNDIGINLIDTPDVHILGNNTDIYNNRVGIMGDNADGLVVRNAEINNNRIGIDLRRTDNAVFENVNVHDNFRGLRLRRSDDAQIIDSVFNDNTRGIVIRNGSDGTLIQDTEINGGRIGLLIDGRQGGTPGDVSVTLEDVTFGGTSSVASMQIQNAEEVGDVVMEGVRFEGDGPVGFRAVGVQGSPLTDVFEPGDLDFNDTFFGADNGLAIELVDSTMDGFAGSAEFEGTSTPAERQARVHDNFVDAPEGTIFGLGADDFSFLFADIANRTDLLEAYYNEVSTAGRAFDAPSIDGVVAPKSFNTDGNLQVSLNATGGSQTQVASNTTAEDLNNLATAAGEDPEEFNDLNPAAGNNYETVECTVDFANDFLGEDVLLADADGSCAADGQDL